MDWAFLAIYLGLFAASLVGAFQALTLLHLGFAALFLLTAFRFSALVEK